MSPHATRHAAQLMLWIRWFFFLPYLSRRPAVSVPPVIFWLCLRPAGVGAGPYSIPSHKKAL